MIKIMGTMGEPTKRSGLAIPENNENNFYQRDWSVHQIYKQYFFRFILATQGGGMAQLEITEDDYFAARKLEVDLDYFLNKYGEKNAVIMNYKDYHEFVPLEEEDTVPFKLVGKKGDGIL